MQKYLSFDKADANNNVDDLYNYLMGEEFEAFSDEFYNIRDIFPVYSRQFWTVDEQETSIITQHLKESEGNEKVTEIIDRNQGSTRPLVLGFINTIEVDSHDEISRLEKLIAEHKKKSITLKDLVLKLDQYGYVSGPALLTDLDKIPKNCSLTVSSRPEEVIIPGYELEYKDGNTFYYSDNSVYELPDVGKYFRYVTDKYSRKQQTHEMVLNYLRKLLDLDNYIVINFVGNCDHTRVFPYVYYDNGVKGKYEGRLNFERNEPLMEMNEDLDLVSSEIRLANMLYVFEYGFSIKGINRADLLRAYYERRLINEKKKAQTIVNLLDHYELRNEKKTFEETIKKHFKSIKYYDIEKYYAFKRKPEGEMKRILKKLSPSLKSHKAAISGSSLLPMLGVDFKPSDIDIYVPIDTDRIIKDCRDIQRHSGAICDDNYCISEDSREDLHIYNERIREVETSIVKNFMSKFTSKDISFEIQHHIATFEADGHKIQIVFVSSNRSIQDIIEEFDFDFLKFYYDGRFIRGSFDAYDSLTSRFSVYRPNISGVLENKLVSKFITARNEFEKIVKFNEDDVIFRTTDSYNHNDQVYEFSAIKHEKFYTLDLKAQERLLKYAKRGFSFSFMNRPVNGIQIFIDGSKYAFNVGNQIDISKVFRSNYLENYLGL